MTYRTRLFIQQYIATALWASTDDMDMPLDSQYSIHDIAPGTRELMEQECLAFLEKAGDTIGMSVASAGHDFWLTRNHHGAGFWDGDWPEHGETLTEIAQEFGECYLYVGDDGKIYQE